jgi:hypothetical protein
MPIETIESKRFNTAQKVLVIDDNPENWRRWRAFTRVFTRPNDLGLKVYSILVKKNTKMLAREIAPLVGAARYSVDKALHDLHELGLVSHEQTKIRPSHRRTLDYWSVDTPVIGILRLIPQQYFSKESS